jgi:signal transduction histidine kinase
VTAIELIQPAPGIWREMDGANTEGGRSAGWSTRRAIAHFALSGLAALVLLGAIGAYLVRQVGRTEAIRDAKHAATLAGRGVAEPYVTPALLRGDPAAIARLDRAVHRGILDGRVVRVKIWRPDGRIVYSDEHRLIGSHYSLAADDLAALRTGSVEAGLSDLSRPENRFERSYDKLLEVYLPINSPTGGNLLFETYERYSSVAASGSRLWRAFAPAFLGTLALLWLVQVPIAWRYARRLAEGQRSREVLLRRAIDSSELERRRIARDLHDGAVQDLAGVSYSLTAAADTIDGSGSARAAAAMREAASGTRRTIKQLRTLLVDIYPPDLHRAGLESALHDLVAPLGPRGIEAHVDVEPIGDLAPALETILYRCAQEALRNVAAHSQATRVDIRLETGDGVVRLVVEDDGRGFSGESAEGHLGLRLLADLAREVGGRLILDSEPGRGTRVCVEVPTT